MSGILQPGRVQIGVVEHHNGQAFPSSTGIGQQFHIFGGLTKLEYGAMAIGTALAERWDIVELSSKPEQAIASLRVAAANIAEAILAECAARQAKDVPTTA